MVSAAAYLLFYRRRSSEPLGGPRLQEIINSYDTRSADDEDNFSGSGEGRRLGGDSSLHGSSSALTGVGAAPPRPQSGSDGVATARTVNPARVAEPPGYRHEVADNDDAAMLFEGDAAMNDGLHVASIEVEDSPVEDVDEGIEMSFNEGSHNGSVGAGAGAGNFPYPGNGSLPGWNWNHVNKLSGAAGGMMRAPSLTSRDHDVDDDMDADGSDIVQDNSSASDDSRRARIDDFNDAEPLDWEDPCPVPDLEDEAQLDMAELHDIAFEGAKKRGGGVQTPLLVGVGGDAGVALGGAIRDNHNEEEAAEIHVEEGEGLKEL